MRPKINQLPSQTSVIMSSNLWSFSSLVYVKLFITNSNPIKLTSHILLFIISNSEPHNHDALGACLWWNKWLLFTITFTLLLHYYKTTKLSCCFSIVPSSSKELQVKGHFSFDENEFAARNFGNQFHLLPLEALHPKEVSDTASTIKHVQKMGPHSWLIVAARGHGHSLRGRAQAPLGIVINMKSRSWQEMQVQMGHSPYIDVSAGELRINILHERAWNMLTWQNDNSLIKNAKFWWWC